MIFLVANDVVMASAASSVIINKEFLQLIVVSNAVNYTLAAVEDNETLSMCNSVSIEEGSVNMV